MTISNWSGLLRRVAHTYKYNNVRYNTTSRSLHRHVYSATVYSILLQQIQKYY